MPKELLKLIPSFEGEFRFLSNFEPAKIDWLGHEFTTAEHAYQASKTEDPLLILLIQGLATPGQAKRAGRQIGPELFRKDWEEIKEEVMFEILWRKFQDPELREKLLQTGEAELQEGNTWGDKLWGVDLQTGEGENKLGKLLMEVRREIRDRSST